MCGQARGLAITLLTTALVGWASPSAACTCAQTSPAGHQPCRAYGAADAVFVGRTLEGSTLRSRSPDGEGGKRVFSLAVEEAFAGVDSTTVEILTGMGDGDCGYDFAIGQRYFVYAHRASQNGPLEVWLCGATRPLARAANDLDYARRLVRGNGVPGIFGVVGRQTRASLYSGTRTEPLAGIPVTVTGAAGYEAHVETDAEGFFEVVGHLAGSYSVHADVDGAPALSVQVPGGGCVEASPAVIETAQIEGLVLTAEATPAAGTEVTLMTATSLRDREHVKTDESGRFVFPEVPAAEYIVAINPDGPLFPWDPPQRALFYPAAEEVAEATPVAAAAGAVVTIEPLRLGPPLATRTIHGRVSWSDGRPLGNVSVGIARPGTEGARLGAKVGPDGRFEATVFADGPYEVDADHYEGHVRNGRASTRIDVWDQDVSVELILEPDA